MSKWISGKELMEQRGLKDFELFEDYVAKGLQPRDEFGHPVSPSNVLEEILDVKALKDELTEHERASEKPVDEDEAHFRADRTFALGKEVDDVESALRAAEGVSWTEFKLPDESERAKAVLVQLSECLFKREDLAAFKKGASPTKATKVEGLSGVSPKPRKLRPNQRHKIACRGEAEKLWKEDESITIADMIQRDELNVACEGKVYGENAMRDWIKDLCPDRSRGRRPKKARK